jgi:BlaI family penicillinase repressor
MPDAPGYSAVRAMMGRLEAKGYLGHRQEGPRFLYFARVPRQEARESALDRLVRTFFDGSTEMTVAALLDRSAGALSAEELDRLASLIAEARKGSA